MWGYSYLRQLFGYTKVMLLKKNTWMVVVLILSAIIIFLFFTGGHTIQLTGEEQSVEPVIVDPNADLPAQLPLANPPEVIKAIYATNWSGGSEKKVKYFLDLLDTTELNAIVLDIKDYTGIVGYEAEVSAVKEYGAFEKRIPKINALIKRFHDAGIYVIGRVAVFQDDALVTARPDLAIKSKKTGEVWGDRKNVHWLDTAATPVWDYNIDIAREALARGFDEINLDYIRFASDGNVEDISYPYYDEKIPKHQVLKQFFDHVRTQLPYARLSADIFGEAVVNNNQTGIGQVLEDTLEPFDYVAPMIYPSHYNPKFLGLKNAAENPYAVIRWSMDVAYKRVAAYQKKLLERSASSTEPLPALTKFRPWLQDFNLGANYDAEKVRAQIIAVDDSARAAAGCPGIKVTDNNHQVAAEPTAPRQPCDYQPIGWMLWNASNAYTKEALLPK